MLKDASEMAAEPEEGSPWPIVEYVIPQDHDSKQHDTTELPADHPITLLSEAMTCYNSDAPPFLCPGRRKIPAESRLEVLLATNGKRKRPAPPVNLVAREWGSGGTYWTADLNGERIILKSFRGGPLGGCHYRRWLGPRKGFEQHATAFGVLNAKLNGKASLGKEGRYLESTDRLTQYGQRRGRAPTRGAERKSRRFTTDEALDSENSLFSPPPKKNVYYPRLKRSTRGSLRKLYSTETENSSSSEHRRQIAKAPSKALRLNVPRGFVATPHLDQTMIERPGKRSKESQSIPNTENVLAPNKLGFFESSKRKTPFDLSTLTRIASKRRKNPFGPQNLTENSLDRHAENPAERKVERPTLPAIDTIDTKCHPSPTAAIAFNISPYKQANTNLCFFLPPGNDYVPLKLRSCMNMSSFFGAAIEAFELQDQTEEIRALRVMFDPFSGGDQKDTWLVKKTIPDSFEIFLDVVDQLPVWDEGGTCRVRVDIIMRG